MKKNIKQAVKAIVADFSDRKGLGDVWDEIDGPIQKEIKKEWARLIEQALETPSSDEPPPCNNHIEVQHRDRKRPWCNACGWNWGRPALPSQQLSTPKDSRPHSRACGPFCRGHEGSSCAPDCPTCLHTRA